MEISFLQLVLLFLPLLLSIIFFSLQNSAKNYSSPCIRTYPIVGNIPQLIKNRNRFFEWITECILTTPNRTITLRTIGGAGGIVTANPANIEHILKTNFHNYPKGDVSIGMLEDFFGHTVFNSDREDWQWQRKAASYEFNRRTLRSFVSEVVHYEVVNRLWPLLKKAADEEKIIDIQEVLERFMFDSICKVAFNIDPACLTDKVDSEAAEARKFAKAIAEAQNIVVGRFRDGFQQTWKIKKLLSIGSERRLKKSVSTLRTYAMNIIKERIGKNLDEYHDLISRFASNNDASVELLRDIVISFIVAGRETSSTALVWLFWVLSERPDVKEKIREEMRMVRASNGVSRETFGFDDLRDMQYLHAAVTESMRLFPPIAADSSMSCLNDDVLPDGTFVRKGWSVTYSAYAMARLEEIWGKDCREYRPERWLENGVFKPGSIYNYPVFHAGPRLCLGKELAYIKIKSVAAAILERFEVEVPVRDEKPELVLSMTLRMKKGLPVKIKEKASAII